jgi:hypothetical protein
MINAYDQPASVGFDWEAEMTNMKRGEPMANALDTQVGGDHYTSMKQQPLEKTYLQYGYDGVKHSLYTKVDKYLTRDKGTDRVDIEKAIHCLQLQLAFYDRSNVAVELYNDRLEPTFSPTKPIDGNK